MSAAEKYFLALKFSVNCLLGWLFSWNVKLYFLRKKKKKKKT